MMDTSVNKEGIDAAQSKLVFSNSVVTKSGSTVHLRLYEGDYMDNARAGCYSILQNYYKRVKGGNDK